MNNKVIAADSKNIEIVRLLQKNPRMSIAELARKIGMSNPAAKERVLRLEKSGLIAGYRLEMAQIASFLRSTCRRLRRSTECWTAFSLTGKRPRRLFNLRRCRLDRRRFQKRPPAVAQNVRDSIDDLKTCGRGDPGGSRDVRSGAEARYLSIEQGTARSTSRFTIR